MHQVGKTALVPCLYCGALLRLSADAETAPIVEQRIGAELIARAKEAALRGGRDEAIALCVREGGVTEAAAAAAVDDMLKNVMHRTLFSQALNLFGWFLIGVSLALVVGGGAMIVGIDAGWRWAGLALIAVGALNLVVLARGVVTSLRFLVAERGTASVRQSVCVGPTGLSDGSLVYSLAIDVVPDRGGGPFHTRLVLPVRATSTHKVAAGARIGVRYADGGAWIRPDSDRVVPQGAE